MDPNRLRQGEQIAGISAIVLFIVMFFDWFGAGSFGASAWKSLNYISPFLAITIFMTLLIVAFRASGRGLGDLPESVTITVLGGLSTLLVLFRLLDPVSSTDRKFGLFLGLIAAAGIAVGGYLSMQDEGTSFDDVANRFGGTGSGTGGRDAGPRGGRDAGRRDPVSEPAPPPPPPPPPSEGGGRPPTA